MSSSQQIAVAATTIPAARVAAQRAGVLHKYFYFFMSLLIAATVVYGFSHTVNANLIHPVPPRPFILYIHAAVFTAWLLFFIFQSALVRTHNVRLHRQTGWFGFALGIAIPLVGISTAIAMAHFRTLSMHATGAESFLIVPLFDMFCFTIPFALAILWRQQPEFHRRLILMATCALTAAAFGRFPPSILPAPWFYAGVDLLILFGVARDLVVIRRIHAVYLYGLPAFIAGQVLVTYSFTHHSAWWLKIAHALLA
jgi:hypothetical protein